MAFTYKLIQKNADVNNNGLAIKGVTTSGDTVTVKFATSQYANFQEIAGTVYIVPQHIWQSVGDPGKFADASPVGTGPYKLQSVSASGVVLTANPDYWGGPFGGKGPAVKTVQFPSLASNTSALTALLTDSGPVVGQLHPRLPEGSCGTSRSSTTRLRATPTRSSRTSASGRPTSWPSARRSASRSTARRSARRARAARSCP